MSPVVGNPHMALAAYALGVLDPGEAAGFEHHHMAGCVQCRSELSELLALRHLLDEMPPEAFVEGPPDGGDLLLQRTLRRIRAERPRALRRPGTGRAFIAVAVVLAALGAGVITGRMTASAPAAPVAQHVTETKVPGTKDARAIDPVTGVGLTAAVAPAAGWVRVKVAVTGVRPGEKCALRVVTKEGTTVVAGSWLASEKSAAEGITLDGSALVAPQDVRSVDIVTLDGRALVSAAV